MQFLVILSLICIQIYLSSQMSMKGLVRIQLRVWQTRFTLDFVRKSVLDECICLCISVLILGWLQITMEIQNKQTTKSKCFTTHNFSSLNLNFLVGNKKLLILQEFLRSQKCKETQEDFCQGYHLKVHLILSPQFITSLALILTYTFRK